MRVRKRSAEKSLKQSHGGEIESWNKKHSKEVGELKSNKNAQLHQVRENYRTKGEAVDENLKLMNGISPEKIRSMCKYYGINPVKASSAVDLHEFAAQNLSTDQISKFLGENP